MKTVIELPNMEKKGGTDAECLLTVTGDTALLNTFDKAFRSGIGPHSSVSRYSLHALFPVPEEVQCRGFSTAGRLWCESYWETEGDLRDMQVKRVLGERRYHFFVPGNPPVNFFRAVSRTYPDLSSIWPRLGAIVTPGSVNSRTHYTNTGLKAAHMREATAGIPNIPLTIC